MPRNALPVALYRPTDDDLAQNRQGRVSRRQKTELMRHVHAQTNGLFLRIILLVGLFLVLSVGLILPGALVIGLLSLPQAQVLLAVWGALVMLVSAVVPIYLGRTIFDEFMAFSRLARDVKRGRLQRTVGQVALFLPDGKTNTRYKMRIRERTLIVDDEQFFSLHDGQTYVVYFFPQSLVVLNTETVKSNPPQANKTG